MLLDGLSTADAITECCVVIALLTAENSRPILRWPAYNTDTHRDTREVLTQRRSKYSMCRLSSSWRQYIKFERSLHKL